MNRFVVFWQSDGAPPDIETIRACGDELARPAGARLQAGVRHNLAYVVASWSFPSIDSREKRGLLHSTTRRSCWPMRGSMTGVRWLRTFRGPFTATSRLETSDVRMLLHAWRAWGEKLRQRVIGDYAFVVADVRTRSLFAVRSHPGWRPLFYAKSRAGVLVASSIDALACHPRYRTVHAMRR